MNKIPCQTAFLSRESNEQCSCNGALESHEVYGENGDIGGSEKGGRYKSIRFGGSASGDITGGGPDSGCGTRRWWRQCCCAWRITQGARLTAVMLSWGRRSGLRSRRRSRPMSMQSTLTVMAQANLCMGGCVDACKAEKLRMCMCIQLLARCCGWGSQSLPSSPLSPRRMDPAHAARRRW